MRRYVWLAAAVLVAAIVFVSVRYITPDRDVQKEKRAPVEIIYQPEEITAKLSIVLDDFGYTRKNLVLLERIDVPLTLAVLPGTPHVEEVLAFAEARDNIEIILHLPMEPTKDNVPLEDDTIMVGMDEEKIRGIISRSLDSVKTAKGVSNHMGSKATADDSVMDIVIDEIKKRDLYFLDSRTSPDSVCSLAADNAGVRCAERDIFIDNVQDEDAVTVQLEKAAETALIFGKAVAIGHDKAVTIETLRKNISRIQSQGVRFVRLSELVEEEE